MRPALIVTIAVTVVLGLVGLFAGKDIWKMMQFGAKEATAVRMEAVADGVLTETVSAPGIVEPMRKVDVSAEVSARIVELPHREGDRVRAGDPSCASTTVT
jgi:HlyD family secretion protein